MKTILIATDFSPASRNASLYGIELAKALEANIILFNSFKKPNSSSKLQESESRYDTMIQADKRLLEEADFLDPKQGVIEICCDEGVAYSSIMNVANEKKVDCIVVGRKGNGNNIKDLFGSTATALAKDVNIPLIIVPENAKFEKSEVRKDTMDILKNIKAEAVLI